MNFLKHSFFLLRFLDYLHDLFQFSSQKKYENYNRAWKVKQAAPLLFPSYNVSCFDKTKSCMFLQTNTPVLIWRLKSSDWPLQKNNITYHNILCLSPQNLAFSNVFSFSWESKWPQEKLKAILMQKFAVTNKGH